MRTIKFYTLGCKANQYDTQSIRERFLAQGFRETSFKSPADFCLINTCTVTSVADQKSRSAIRSAINKNPKAKIIVTGCLVSKDAKVLSGQVKCVDYIIDKGFFSDGISEFCGHTRAFLKIQDGCDNFCSYCKVPLVRGRSRSRQLKDIEDEARRLAKNGFKEIVLTGICLGAYGKDLRPETNLVKLVRLLEKIKGILRIRLSSIEAGDVTPELIDLMSNSKKLCRHLHIPIQSGDERILKKMNRKYTSRSYLNLIRKIRKLIPDIGISTDVLVGFPTESEDSFQNTLDLVKQIAPMRTHIFPYSAREGTAAVQIKEVVEPGIIKKRMARIREAADKYADDFRKRFEGRALEVIFEQRVKGAKDYWEGYTDNYIRMKIKSATNLKNRLVKIKKGDATLPKSTCPLFD